MIDSRLAQKLDFAFFLSEDERLSIKNLIYTDIQHAKPRETIVQVGKRQSAAILILEGAACRYKLLPDGRRQIAAFMLPGDMCDPRVCFLHALDHSIAATSALKFVRLDWASIGALTNRQPNLARMMLWAKQVDESIARELAMSLGQRTAVERVAHLLCELFVRLERVGLAGPEGFRMQMTQGDLAAALGLSIVHINRVLQQLRARKLIVLRGRQVQTPSFEALAAEAHFSRDYLDLGFGQASSRSL